MTYPFAESHILRGLLQAYSHRDAAHSYCGAALPPSPARHPQHKVYPYLLRRKTVVHINQFRAMDITDVGVRKGWMYLCAVVDEYSRKVLAWRLSNTWM